MDKDNPIPQIKATRVCLSCDKEFKSLGAGHRICSICTNKHNKASPYLDKIPLPVPEEYKEEY